MTGILFINRRWSRHAFTLTEVLFVVIILGVLASILIPQFSNASVTARENSLKDDLRAMRNQIEVFKAQHWDVAPGYPGGDRSAAPSAADLLAHMTQYSDEWCDVSAAATATHRFGPYVNRLPANPLNGLDTVLVVANGQAMPAPDDSTGWIYKPQTVELIANTSRSDATGTPYASY